MNYFQPYPLCVDETVTTAWNSQLAEAENTPWLARTLSQRAIELFPRFVATYSGLRALPRGARRALQRQLARSGELTAMLPEWLQGSAGRALQHKLARSLAGAALLLALGQGVAQANQISVTAKSPVINLGDGLCSLAEAIISANYDIAYGGCTTGFGADTIVLPKGTQALTNYYTHFGFTGLPLITSQITIEGNGAKIIRSKKALSFGLMAVGPSGNLTLNNVTLSGGVSTGRGGAVANFLGALTITNSTISGNQAFGGGGGVYTLGGSVVIDASTISKNSAGQGAGIVNYFGYVHISDCTITGNLSSLAGGGVANLLGKLVIDPSTISKNTADAGGGIFDFRGHTYISDSLITGNKATLNFGGGIYSYEGYILVDPSTISKNSAIYGGGIANIRGTVRLLNSNVTGNKASAKGGGVYNSSATFLNYGTVTGNKAPVGPNTFP